MSKHITTRYSLLKIDWRSYSIWSLILVNGIAIIWAVIDHWSLTNLIWIYWFQSVIIGIFQVRKILDLKKFSTTDLKMNGRPVEPTDFWKKYIATFFFFHYGGFHFVYFIFLTQIAGSIVWSPMLFVILVFFINHLCSYLYNKEEDSTKIRNIGKMMFFPYVRIIPMHLMILFGLFVSESTVSLVFFMILKTIADLLMHNKEHK